MNNLEKITTALNKEESESKNAKQIIESSIEKAIQNGIIITRGAIFDWCSLERTNKYAVKGSRTPTYCNALGAVLLAYGKETLAYDGFAPDWLDQLCKIIDVDKTWIWRFCHGFDCGNRLKISVQRKDSDKEDVIEDKVSIYGDKLAKNMRIIIDFLILLLLY